MFCASCGASLAAQIHCPSCNTLNPLGRGYCTRCGSSLEHAGWGVAVDPGAIVDGEWQRGDGELIRRVDPDEARRFLGTRTVRVPAGAVGVVLVDGVVDRVLPPGAQTSVSLFERVRSFFTGRERTAFYLVDQRPFPVPFVVRTRPDPGGELVKTQVMVTFLLPKGDRDALATFIAAVMGARASVSTAELYNEVRPEVARIAQEVLERQGTTGDYDYVAAEAEIRRRLADGLARRYGLTADATLAPLTAVASLDLWLGTGVAPRTRACTRCGSELPQSLRFCDRCGEQQPVVAIGATATDATTPLFTADGQQVELDVVVRAQGQHDDFTAVHVAPVVVPVVAAYLRGVGFGAVTGAGGFAALELAVAPALTSVLAGLGMSLVAFAVVDARSKTGQWVLAARADLDRAAEDVRIGMAWLGQRDAELDLEQLAIARALRAQQQHRDHGFADATAAVADRERRDAISARGAAIDVAVIQRDAAVAATRQAVDHDHALNDTAHDVVMRRTRVEGELAELERRRRLELDLARIAEHQQLDKLRAMAVLDRELADQEQAHVMARRAALAGLMPEQMIAMQAAELAGSEGGGAAWASALATRADDEKRHAAEQRGIYDRAMTAMAQVAASRAEPAPIVAGSAPIVVGATGVVGAATRTCTHCGAAMKPDARFCGACGATPEV
jgi:hypothetical protein